MIKLKNVRSSDTQDKFIHTTLWKSELSHINIHLFCGRQAVGEHIV